MDIERCDTMEAADLGGERTRPLAVRRGRKAKRAKNAKSESQKAPAWKRLEEIEEEKQLRRELSYFPDDL